MRVDDQRSAEIDLRVARRNGGIRYPPKRSLFLATTSIRKSARALIRLDFAKSVCMTR